MNFNIPLRCSCIGHARRRYFGSTPTSILPKLSFDRKKWPSTVSSNKKLVDLDNLEQEFVGAGVKYIAPSFIDMHGIPKAKMVPIHGDHGLYSCSRGSEMFTGAAVDGVPQAISDDEVCAVADPASLCVQLPHRKDVCYVPASLYYHGTQFEPCSRNIYSRVAQRAKEMGFMMKLGIEAEFFVLRDSDDVDEMRKQEPFCSLENLHKPCYDLSRLIDNMPWMSDLVDSMNELGYDVYSFDHEDAVGQFEVDFRFDEAALMSDKFVLLRMLLCSIVREHGCYASWMPKPMKSRTGNGGHLNISLHDFDTEENLFKPAAPIDGSENDGDAERHLSELGRHFLGGVMAHIDAIVAVSCPTVNSYKRMVWTPPPTSEEETSGFSWAPVVASYGANNRTNAIRIPAPGRFEIRSCDSAVNPHLASALVLAAGLHGIENQLDPGPSRGHDNLYQSATTTTDNSNDGLKLLPRDLGEAIHAFENDPLTKAVFGDRMYESWLKFKKTEWNDYCKHVSDWEVERYLRQFG